MWPESGITTPHRHFAKRRLAGAVVAEDRDDLAAAQLEGDVVQRADVAVDLADAVGSDDHVAGRGYLER